MSDDLPEPLTPTDCDLRGLEYMPLLGNNLFGSAFNARANDAEWRAAITLWWAAWTEIPAASLPDDDIVLCNFAGLGKNFRVWRKIKAMALYGFVKCSDGRFYHKNLAEQALIAWEKRSSHRVNRASDAERKAREREARSQMFQQLNAVGINPAWNTKTTELRELVTLHYGVMSQEPVTEPVTNDCDNPEPVTPPVTRTVTAKTGRDGTGRDGKEDKERERLLLDSTVGDACEDRDPASGGSKFVFEGTVIRLNADDFNRWQQAFHAIPDLRAELTSIDIWLSEPGTDRAKRWFHKVSGSLNRKHQEFLSAKAKAEKEETGFTGFA